MSAPLRHIGRRPPRAGGIALPVMLIILAVMLTGSLYLLRSSNSGTLGAANLAYDSALVRAADLGLMRAFEWLDSTARANKPSLDQPSSKSNTSSSGNADDNGYWAHFDTSKTVADREFWVGSKVIVDTAGNTIEYVIHRMCALPGPYTPPGNSCMQTADTGGSGTLEMEAEKLNLPPQVHYVLTARIFGPRGGNVVSQMVVLIRA